MAWFLFPPKMKVLLALTLTLRFWQLSHASDARIRGALFIGIETKEWSTKDDVRFSYDGNGGWI
jgi:hypothetical protein